MWQDVKDNYRAAIGFALACPLLFLIPVAGEFAQHVVEINLGMYQSLAAFKAQAASSDRMGMGFLKVAVLLLPGWWFMRYLGFGQSVPAARRLEWPAFGLWLVVLGWSLGLGLLGLFGPSPGALLGLGKIGTLALSAMLQMGNLTLSLYLTAWAAAWPLGNAAIGPLVSIRLMHGHVWRALGYALAGSMPLMAVHYALGYGSVGLAAPLVWAVMALDALVAGVLALTITGSVWFAARHAAKAKGMALRPAGVTTDG